MYKIKIFIHLNFLLFTTTSAFNCKLPNACQINDVHFQINLMAHEKTSIGIAGILCDIRDEKFQFTFPNPPLLDSNHWWCEIEDALNQYIIEFRFHSMLILSKQFNFNNILRYSFYFDYSIIVNLVNLNGFELDMINDL